MFSWDFIVCNTDSRGRLSLQCYLLVLAVERLFRQSEGAIYKSPFLCAICINIQPVCIVPYYQKSFETAFFTYLSPIFMIKYNQQIFGM